MNLTPYQYHILREIGKWHGEASNHMIWEYTGPPDYPHDTPLSACHKLESEGLVEQSMPGKTASKWKLTELGQKTLDAYEDTQGGTQS